MAQADYVFTSESVAEGHPDKICDRISDAIVDAFLTADPYSRLGCETLVTTNRIVIAGEVREWESVEYVRDQVFSGSGKGLILVGRVVSEEPGMAVCADWLKTLVPEVPVRHISAGDPYWRPV